jgi:hypothetical protein
VIENSSIARVVAILTNQRNRKRRLRNMN